MQIPSTMPEQVSIAEELEISYRTLHPAAILHDGASNRTTKIPFSSLTNKYKDVLSTIIVNIEMTDVDIAVYRFRPKKLSLDLYNTTELWSDLMVINNCTSLKDFQINSLNYYDPSKLKKILNEIYILEGIID